MTTEELRKEYFIAVGQGKVKDVETAWTFIAPHLSTPQHEAEIKREAVEGFVEWLAEKEMIERQPDFTMITVHEGKRYRKKQAEEYLLTS